MSTVVDGPADRSDPRKEDEDVARFGMIPVVTTSTTARVTAVVRSSPGSGGRYDTSTECRSASTVTTARPQLCSEQASVERCRHHDHPKVLSQTAAVSR